MNTIKILILGGVYFAAIFAAAFVVNAFTGNGFAVSLAFAAAGFVSIEAAARQIEGPQSKGKTDAND